MAEQFRIIEYPLIIIFILIGGIFLLSSSDFISVFLCIELQSYGLYILSTVYRNSERATSGGLTYFLLGGLSSCFILLGSSLLYANTGNTAFDSMYIIFNISNELPCESYPDIQNISWLGEINNYFNIFYNSNYFNYAFIILSVGFLFKIAAAPFHFWSPDVYDAIPTVVTTFVAIFAKISIFILLLELVHYTSNYTNNNVSWTVTLLISSLLSLIIGSVLGLVQFRIKRLYAYSTISHVGFILLALSINTVESTQSFLFYLTQYSISNLNAFILLLSIGYTLYIYKEKNENNIVAEATSNSNEIMLDRKNSPIQLISQLKGYFYVNPLLSISFAITIFSFVGIPPLVGFFGKQMILSSALDNGYIFMSLVAILTSVISAYYYLSVIKQIFFNISDYVINSSLKSLSISLKIVDIFNNKSVQNRTVPINNIVLSSYLSVTISIITLFILLFILNPQEWLNLTMVLSLSLFTC